MKKFKFTLKSLLNVKQALEKQRKAELRAAAAIRDGFVRGLCEMEKRLDDQRSRLVQQGGQSVGLAEFAVRSRGFQALFLHMDEQKEKIRVAEIEAARILNLLTGVMTERKVLEKLREKQYTLYREEMSREENIIVDEFMSFKIHKSE